MIIEIYSKEKKKKKEKNYLKQMICLWNQVQFYFIIHNLSKIFIHFLLKKKKMLICQHADYLLKGQMSVFPWKFLCSLSQGIFKICAGLFDVSSYMTGNSHRFYLQFQHHFTELTVLANSLSHWTLWILNTFTRRK